MRTRKLWLTVYAVLAVSYLASASPARADAAKEGKDHFLKAKALVEAKKFKEAIGEFEKSYALNPLPVVMYNIGVCHKKLGENAAGIAAMKLYREKLGDKITKAEKEEVEASIAEMEKLAGTKAAAEGAAGAAAKVDGKEAAAKPVDEEGAKAHFQQGALLYNEGGYPKALVEFKQSYAIKPNWKVRFSIGVTLHAMHRFVEAEKELKGYLAEGGAEIPPDKKAQAEDLLAQLAGVIGSLKVACAVAGASVYLDDELAGKTPLAAPLRLDVGSYKVKVAMAGYEDFKKTVELSPVLPLGLAVSGRF